MALAFCGKKLFQAKYSLTRTSIRHAYVVLVPEIGEDLPEKNPLLQKDGLPEFNNLTIENCMAAIGKQTLEFETNLQILEGNLANAPKDIFKNIFTPLEELSTSLDLTWGLSKTLYLGNSSLMPTKSYLAIHDRSKRSRSTKYNSLPIYECVKDEILKEDPNRTDEENRILKKFALESKLNGLDLNNQKKAHLELTLNKLTTEKIKFNGRIDLTTKQFSHTINEPLLARELPMDLLKSTSMNPTNYLQGPWRVTLQPHISVPFIEHCSDPVLRWNVWQALVGRGSDYHDKEYGTSVHLEEIRSLRKTQANLLGYDTFVDMSMETKMAGSLENVQTMLSSLLEYAKPAQEEEIAKLYEFAKERGFGGPRIELWDLPYWNRKQKKTLFNYVEEEYQNYFPLTNVLEGLFSLTEKFFNVKIKQRMGVSTWHKEVKFYDIFEGDSPIAGFYLDPYARNEEKMRIPQSGGWMVGIQNRSQIAETSPLASLIFNFQPPAADKPSLLAFKEVQSLFHRFGNALQHLLTRTKYSEVAGVSNIEWDAVQVSGNVFEHFLLNETVITSMSSHYESQQKLPLDMYNSLVNVSKHGAGADLCRELYLSALDLELHSCDEFWLNVVKRLWPQFRSFPLHKLDSHPCSFTQIFAEEWGAAYYSQIWSKIIAADVYSAFYEVSSDENETLNVAKRYRDTFLALGGGCHPNKIFRKFRGRDPSPKALLRSLDLKKKKVITDQ